MASFSLAGSVVVESDGLEERGAVGFVPFLGEDLVEEVVFVAGNAVVAIGFLGQPAGAVVLKVAAEVELVDFARHSAESVVMPGRRIVVRIGQRMTAAGGVVRIVRPRRILSLWIAIAIGLGDLRQAVGLVVGVDGFVPNWIDDGGEIADAVIAVERKRCGIGVAGVGIRLGESGPAAGAVVEEAGDAAEGIGLAGDEAAGVEGVTVTGTSVVVVELPSGSRPVMVTVRLMAL